MKKRQFGSNGPELTELCIGPMRFNKPGTSGPRQENPHDALDVAISSGITTIHSSAEYTSFDDLSQRLQSHPQRAELQHIVKLSNPEYGEDAFDKKRFVDDIDELLSSLATEQLTVVQHLQRGPVHKEIVYDESADESRIGVWNAIKDDVLDTAQELRTQGKIGAFASFPHTMDYAKQVISDSVVDGIVHYFNLIEVEAAQLFSRLAANGQGFISLRPYLQGMLTDLQADRTTIDPDSKFANPGWDEAYARLSLVQKYLEADPRIGLTAQAIRFTLSFPEVTTTVVGLNTTSQIEEAVSVAEQQPLDAGTRDAIVQEVLDAGLIDKNNLFG